MIELMPHQMKAVEKAREMKNLAIFFEAGTGKTATTITILREEWNRSKRVVPTLILAPLSVCAQWPGEFEKFSKLPRYKILTLTGKGKERAEELAKKLEQGEREIVVITNYEAVQIKEFYKLLLKWSPEILILDESHRIKDSQSKRAKAIYPLTLCARRRFILTGTPILNSLMDIFGQYKALDPSIFGPGFWTFRTKYFYNRNAGKQFSFPDWVPTPTAAKQIGDAIATSSVQAKRDECLKLPPLQRIVVPIKLEGKQRKSYDEMKKEFITEVNGMTSSSEFEMVKTLRMQQILAGFIQPDDSEEPVWFDEQPRLDAMSDILDSIGKEKAIIWTVFRPTYEKISQRLTRDGISHTFITGEQNTDAKKQEAIKEFTQGEAQVLIANPAAASEGINLQVAKYAIYYMRGYNLLHYLQSMARNYRKGSENLHKSVAHYHIVAKGTLDEVIAYALATKQNMGQAVLNWSRSQDTSKFDLALIDDKDYDL